ncbi:DEAD-box ATP-dependent RNA helicase [Rhizophlyctis rosea]|nr:DEAD-box ATP-dependent RNA helicase [Rhizophlyctis rosea]
MSPAVLTTFASKFSKFDTPAIIKLPEYKNDCCFVVLLKATPDLPFRTGYRKPICSFVNVVQRDSNEAKSFGLIKEVTVKEWGREWGVGVAKITKAAAAAVLAWRESENIDRSPLTRWKGVWFYVGMWSDSGVLINFVEPEHSHDDFGLDIDGILESGSVIESEAVQWHRRKNIASVVEVDIPPAEEEDSLADRPDIKPRDLMLERALLGPPDNRGNNFDDADDVAIDVSGHDAPPPLTEFINGNLDCLVMSNILKSGYKTPTRIQQRTIPIIAAGRDCMICAETSANLMAGYLLPILSMTMTQGPPNTLEHYFNPNAKSTPVILILAPTRELVLQIYEESRKFAYRSWVRSCVVYDSQPAAEQTLDLNQGCDLLIATPVSLVDLIEQGRVSLAKARYLVLDEADRMLDMGFDPVIRRVVQDKDMGPSEERQVIIMAYDYPLTLQNLVKETLLDPLFLGVGEVPESFAEVMKNEGKRAGVRKGKMGGAGGLKEFLKNLQKWNARVDAADESRFRRSPRGRRDDVGSEVESDDDAFAGGGVTPQRTPTPTEEQQNKTPTPSPTNQSKLAKAFASIGKKVGGSVRRRRVLESVAEEEGGAGLGQGRLRRGGGEGRRGGGGSRPGSFLDEEGRGGGQGGSSGRGSGGNAAGGGGDDDAEEDKKGRKFAGGWQPFRVPIFSLSFPSIWDYGDLREQFPTFPRVTRPLATTRTRRENAGWNRRFSPRLDGTGKGYVMSDFRTVWSDEGVKEEKEESEDSGGSGEKGGRGTPTRPGRRERDGDGGDGDAAGGGGGGGGMLFV